MSTEITPNPYTNKSIYPAYQRVREAPLLPPFSRRQFLLGAGSFVFGITGLAMAGKVLSESIPEPSGHVPTPEASSTPTSIDISPHGASYALTVDRGIPLKDTDREAIDSAMQRWEDFEPARTISIGEYGTLWSVLGDHISFSKELFDGSFVMLKKRDVEISFAILLSTLKRVLTDGNDGRKISTLGDYMKWFDNLEPFQAVDTWREGITMFNPYRNIRSEAEDIEEYDEKMQEPMNNFAGVTLSHVLNLGGIKQQILSYPTTITSYSGMYPGEGLSTHITEDQRKTVAKAEVRETTVLLMALAQKKGETRGEGSLKTIIDTAIDGFGGMRYDIGVVT